MSNQWTQDKLPLFTTAADLTTTKLLNDKSNDKERTSYSPTDSATYTSLHALLQQPNTTTDQLNSSLVAL